ncbi:Energy-coupling factor transporter transmembrane protein EcfT [Rhynchospora pubera]|uniref:Energy-coupling factor transporter transmembrane protein EcfT n=1 Tax=Rhynchospora pubera TaxID=906938 RepID=A0AAV8E0R8_9POAL|nr:Energy-coupling factor transporter transmembrane protein EcfT [Rhynchospora pubera]
MTNHLLNLSSSPFLSATLFNSRPPLHLSSLPLPLPLLSISSLNKPTRLLKPAGRSSTLLISCSAASSSGDGRSPPKWTSWVPLGGGFSPEKILRLISGATSSPICQFIDAPRTFLHSLDPRVKLVWLLGLVLIPARSHLYMRLGLVLYLSLLSILVLPSDVWKDQLGRVALLSGILFIMLGFGSDGVAAVAQTRTPPASLTGLPHLPSSVQGYSYSIFKLGPLQFTRKGLSVATTSACLTFTIFQSASLCLATTPPEQLAFALWWFMTPLRNVGVPVSEITLTLLLSLRFISLVFDEVRDGAVAIVARRVNWSQLSSLETLDIFVSYIRRIFNNIFNHSEQISQAMIVRGFDGECENHKFYFQEPSVGVKDFVSLLCFFALVAAAAVSDRLM